CSMPIRVSGQGSGRPYIRFTPQANAWVQAGLDGPEEFDVTAAPLCFDIANLQLGWMMLAEGVREWQPWPSLTQRTPKPSEGDWKIGFTIPVYSTKLLGSEVHDFSANSTASTRFIENLYNECEEDLDPEKAVVVQITGSKPLKVGKGNTREVLYTVVKWIPRPAAFDAKGNGEDDMFQKKPTGPKKPPSPPSPPKAVARPAPRQADPVDEADEF
ncbi:MAG: hypothetical protein ABWY82_04630, partial [Tardiphaga sp.]